MFEIEFRKEVIEADLPKIDIVWQKKIKQAIQSKLSAQPQLYGKPLRRSLKNYRKLRVGNYRIIFSIDGSIVKIFAIQHRSEVYKQSVKRL
ncbi:type II toxin-antitoxin system RelE/ParE family toxin [Candidatus Saccharibacteria bacterium]|nr:type II toxin-antitoxin system RelE/ParE family toxin [Candidatus Saccharibacteria bacterium]